jgi:hypothetical protein
MTRTTILFAMLLVAGCVFGDRFYGVLPRTERPQTFDLSVEPTHRRALVSHVSLLRTDSPDAAIRSRGGKEVWRVVAVSPTPAQDFQFDLLKTPPGFNCEIYPASGVKPNGNYYLEVWLHSAEPSLSRGERSGRKRYSIAVYERSFIHAR